ncbi:hypothetical protein NO559_07715 [Dasania sp. GY-MA-18]|uniref:Uncharacterized protein n=1 Tax=Dasania phycosphaerae TaxID=2950436 RepID=A0A9J6RKQ8_9GAMM|nr:MULTISPECIES: hypothetical protein [Dasania]MCR8922653.1 hypothetical protein [Dasania sp. GY-MA-18]MCZ0865083.1 hypothetical protein [Dasania phycosphaerae]MCZ0868809.1 hypothetical protein [Dasania phycosphaerae]
MSQSNQCRTCKHYWGAHACDAFTQRIPDEIFTGQVDHSSEYPGDNGIRFELADEYKEVKDETTGQ